MSGRKTCSWIKPNDKRSTAHVVTAGNKEDGYTFACGRTSPEREGVQLDLNHEEAELCGLCARSFNSGKGDGGGGEEQDDES